ncbi:MAG: hypothetical protein AB1689_24695 [Thermodesulfobacteriota bacterium]
MHTPRAFHLRGGASLTLAVLLLTSTQALAELPTVTITVADPTAAELGLETGALTLTRSGGNLAAALSVGIGRGGGASNGADYAFVSSQIPIPANETSVTVLVTPLADNLAEGDEQVTLTIQPQLDYETGSTRSRAT